MLIVSQVLYGPVGSKEREKSGVLCSLCDDDLGFGLVVTSKAAFLPTWSRGSSAARVTGSQPGASEFIQKLALCSETKVEQSLRKFCLTLT